MCITIHVYIQTYVYIPAVISSSHLWQLRVGCYTLVRLAEPSDAWAIVTVGMLKTSLSSTVWSDNHEQQPLDEIGWLGGQQLITFFFCLFFWPLFRWLKANKWAKLDCWRRSKAVGLGVHATGSTASHCTYQLEDASSVWCCCVALSYCWCMSSMVFKIEPWTHAFHIKISTWLTSL